MCTTTTKLVVRIVSKFWGSLHAPLAAGEEATFTLTFSDGSTIDFTAPVKDYTGANEEYVGDDMDMGN